MRPALIFDLDGTLIDSLPDIHATANALLAELGEPPLTRDQARSFIGHGAAHFATRMAETREIDPHRLIGAYSKALSQATTRTHPFPGVVEALNRLYDAGYPLALCTNKPDAATKTVLEATGLTDFFQIVVAGDTLPQRKPDPAPLHHALTLTGAKSALYIGDSEVDAAAAKAAAMPFALYTEGYRQTPVTSLPHAFAFDDFNDLPDLIAAFEVA